MVNTTQLYALTLPFPDYARKLWISKIYEKPIREIQNLASGVKSKPQYRLYSAHDTQVANIIEQLVPSYNFTYVKYASNIYMMAYASPEGEIFV